MITMLCIFMSLSFMMILASSSPVKLSTAALIIAMINFCFLAEMTGTVWFSLILTLLFMGGILIMFMIISALFPNEKTKNMKIFTPMIVASSIVLSHQISPDIPNSVSSVKSFVAKEQNILILVVALSAYFLIFTQILKKKSSPLRSSLCC